MEPPQSDRRSRREQLLPGETVLWTGKPVRYPLFGLHDLFLVPISLFWCTIVAVVGADVLADLFSGKVEPTFALVFFIPFVLVGLYLLVGRFVVRWLCLRGSSYTVTDQRVRVETRVLGFSWTRSEYLRDLEPPEPRIREDGTGTIWFGDSGLMKQLAAAYPQSVPKRPIVLYEIPHARRVADLIAAAQRK